MPELRNFPKKRAGDLAGAPQEFVDAVTHKANQISKSSTSCICGNVVKKKVTIQNCADII